jgi:hypothetical protein
VWDASFFGVDSRKGLLGHIIANGTGQEATRKRRGGSNVGSTVWQRVAIKVKPLTSSTSSASKGMKEE